MRFRNVRLTGTPGLAALAMVAALLAGPPATAEEQPKETKVTAQAPTGTTAAPFASGQKAAIDPQTKKLRQPTQEEAAELDKNATPATAVESFRSVQLPSGAVMAEVPESMMDTAVVQLSPDGSLQTTCFQGLAAADAAVKAGAPRSTAKLPASTEKKAPTPPEEK